MSQNINNLNQQLNDDNLRSQNYGSIIENGINNDDDGDNDDNNFNNRKYSINTKLTFYEKIGYGFGHIFNDLCAGMWFSYTLLYMKSTQLIPASIAGGLMMLGQVSDAISTPIVGILSDRYSTKRKWHILGTGLVLISFPIIFSICPNCIFTSNKWWPPLFLSSFIIIFQFGWAMVQITHLSMIPELSFTTQDRSDLTAIRYSFSIISNCCGSSITMISSLCITADMIGSKHTKNGGLIYSAVTFADKLITGIVVVVIESLKCDNDKKCPNYYRDVLSFGCGAASVFGIIILITLKLNTNSQIETDSNIEQQQQQHRRIEDQQENE